jgi:hypothetical protein
MKSGEQSIEIKLNIKMKSYMTVKLKMNSREKQFMHDILPILEEYNFDNIRKNYSEKIVKVVYINTLWYRLQIGMIGKIIEIVISRANNITSNFDIHKRTYPVIYESGWVYLLQDCSTKLFPKQNQRFGFDKKYYISGYEYKKMKPNFCIYCNTFIYSAFNTHLLRNKHIQNFKKYIEIVENVLQVRSVKLNIDVIKYIFSFIEY